MTSICKLKAINFTYMNLYAKERQKKHPPAHQYAAGVLFFIQTYRRPLCAELGVVFVASAIEPAEI